MAPITSRRLAAHAPIAHRRVADTALCILLFALLHGCASPPPPKPAAPPPRTHVVLLPDDDGRVGSLTVEGGAGVPLVVNQAYNSTSVASGQLAQADPPRALDSAAVQTRYGRLLQAQPLPPVRHIVYFLLDKAQLTEASKASLASVLAAVQQRKPTEITVYGHADPSGSRERNLRLSAERAQAVADWLRAADPTLGTIHVQFFGDRQPPSDADASTDPARYRRAEIQIL
ncbi:MAG: hypothetical protein RIQ60_282 [Pseudomonadota bacterium]|jgi:outer membrane protein OmpA-like peptidoglycan-associated protein